MKNLLIRLYALLSYVLFMAAFADFIFFVAGWGVPRTVDSGLPASPAEAIAIDLGLIFFFGFLHSLMARRGFKTIWTTIVPVAAERSTYVLVASAQIALLCWQWRP